MNWSEREDELRFLVEQGLSARSIGEVMGAKKSAVIGACNRRGIKLKCAQGRSSGELVNAVKRKRANTKRSNERAWTWDSPAMTRADRLVAKAALELSPIPDDEPFDGALNIPFMDVSRDQCRAVTGHDGLAIFCGLPTVNGSKFSFCRHHAADYIKMYIEPAKRVKATA